MINTVQRANRNARLSALVEPREGSCLNVMDADAHALQAQHRNRYARISIAPMFKGYSATPQPLQVLPHAY